MNPLLPKRHLARIAIAVAALAGTVCVSHAGTLTWVSMGDDAYQLLKAQGTPARDVEQHDITVAVPAERGAAASVAKALVQRQERIHVVQVDDGALHALSEAVHDKLHHCGGYIVHASLADARESVARTKLQAGAGRSPLSATVPSYAIDNQDTVNALLPQLQESHVLSAIQTLSDYQNRYFNSTHGVAVSNDLAKTWKALARGRSDVTVEQYQHKMWPQKSVILTIRGSKAPEEIIVIGGHLDSITNRIAFNDSRSPGADDDASGIASLSEAARVLLASNYRPKRTIQFIAYAAEEEGLRGSAAIAKRYRNEGRNVIGVMQLDMTNYQGPSADMVFMTDYTNAAQNDFLQRLAGTYLPTLKIALDVCGYACSDHASWTENGYAASIPAESLYDEGSPYLHTTEDTLDKSGNNAAHAIEFSRIALAYAVELGSDAPAAFSLPIPRIALALLGDVAHQIANSAGP